MVTYFEQEEVIKWTLINKYRNSTDIGIQKVLKYYTETSEGYMFFLYDAVLEFRWGIVYGRK